MRIELCGRAAIVGPGGKRAIVGRPQVQLCLAALVFERHRPMSRDELAHVLWGDELSAHWRGALRGVLAKLRTTFAEAGFDEGVVEANGGLVALALPDDVEIDVVGARDAARLAETSLRDGLAAEAVDRSRRAVDVLNQGFLPALDTSWANERRYELAELSRQASRLLAQASIESGDALGAVPVLRRLADQDPFDEDVEILLLQALAAAGSAQDVRRAQDRYAAALEHELGVGPSSRVLKAAEELAARAQSPAPAHRAQVTAEPRSGRGARAARAAPFVGRSRELADLVAETVAALERDTARLIVVQGEPGVGKTRLAAELAGEASQAGVRVLWGRCDADGRLPYQPVAEALSSAIADDPSARRALRDLLADLAPLGVSAAVTGTDRPAGTQDRAALGSVLATALERLATSSLLWVIDDMQWIGADAATLLQRTFEHLAAVPLTVVALSRHPDPDAAGLLADLALAVPTRTIRIAGLDRDAVATWLDAARIAHAHAIAGQLRQRTGGNALFLRELVHAAAGQGGVLEPTAVPRALRDLLDWRLGGLDHETNLALAVTAIGGPLVDLAFVAEVAALDAAAALRATDRLVSEGLLAEQDAVLELSHALVRDVVLDRLGAARRSWFHLRAAETLLREAERPGVASELARHYASAGPAHGDAARRWSLVAARDALDRAAWDRAAELARGVLAARAAAPDDRACALVVLGRALRGLGDGDGADGALSEALELARLHGLPRRFGDAVLALAGGGGRGVPDAARFRWVALLEEALADLDDCDDEESRDHDDVELRVPLLGALAVALLLTDRDDDRYAAANRALALARRANDPTLMARALLDHRFALGAQHAAQRVREVDEALALAERAHLPEVRAAALVYRHEDLLLLGDREGAGATLDEARAHLARHPDPYWEWATATWEVVEHLLAGDLDLAERAAGVAWSLDPDGAWAQACFGVNLVAIRILQGRTSEVLAPLEAAARDNPHIPCYRAVHAFAALEVGDDHRARRELERFAADGWDAVPDDTNRLLTLVMLAEVAVGLRAAEHAEGLLTVLRPYADLHVVLNVYGGGGAVWGPTAAHLAPLAALTGDHHAAADWYRQAQARCHRIGDRGFSERLAGVLATPD